MNTTTKTTDRADDLARRALRLLATDEYMPGRAHFAAIIAERIYHEVVGLCLAPRATSVGRATLAGYVWRLFIVAGNPARAEGARMLGASVMGTRLDGGSLDVAA